MRLRRSALSFLLLTGLSLGALSPARAAEDPTPGPAGRAMSPEAVAHALSVPSSHADARRALGEVDDLFGPMSRAEARSKIASGEGRDATLALRDLSLRLGSLSTTERNAAYADFQRPWTDNNSAYETYCDPGVSFCVHWLSKTLYPDNVNASDDTWVMHRVVPTLRNVRNTYLAAGFRPTRQDGPRDDHQLMYGGTPATDIYLKDIGDEGKYGYCTVDVDDTGHYVYSPSNSHASDLPAFCVLDNDYSKTQFQTGHTPLQDLQVTAAHEYFHAVQFAYDYLEDRWFMEATATWAEDELYDSINDNVQYLARSQLRFPGVSLDTFNGAGGFLHYGDWLYFRYLTERLPAEKGPLPALMLRMWQWADSVSGPDLYSVQAVATALREKGLDFNRTFGQYAAANRHPASAYSEGRANHYPTTGPRRTFRLKPGHRSASASYRVNHLASATVRFVPRKLRRSKLRLTVDMANRRTGSVAVALVYFKSGRIATRVVKLGRGGNGSVRVPFSSRSVARVEMVLANANHAYHDCWTDTVYSCSGVPSRNNVLEKVTARAS